MAGFKGFIQFLSIIVSVILITYVTSADYGKSLLNYTEDLYNYSDYEEGHSESSGYYDISNDDEILKGTVSEPSAPDNSTEAMVLKYLETEKIYTEKEGSKVLSFTGDCSLGSINKSAVEEGGFYNLTKESGSETYPFDNVKAFFENDDLTLINLEGALTKSEKQANKYFKIRGLPEWAGSMIAASSIEACSLSNNHSYDYLKAGYEETMKSLDEAGVLYTTDSKPIVTKAGDIEVVILSGNYVNDGVEVGKRGDKLTKQICDYIKQYKKENNIVVVFCHWGKEQKDTPNKNQRDAAHSFVNSGADLVLGHHPHVLQGAEVYGEKHIFYSLGNFAFGGNSGVSTATNRSMIVRPRVALKNGKAEITGISVVPCYSSSAGNSRNNYKPVPLFGKDAQKLSDYIITISKNIDGGVTQLSVLSTSIDKAEQ